MMRWKYSTLTAPNSTSTNLMGPLLGKGSFGTVYLIHAPAETQNGKLQPNAQYALKVMSKEILKKKRMLGSVCDEITVLQRIRKTGVRCCVNFVDVFESPKSIYIVMNVARGVSLVEYCRYLKLFERKFPSHLIRVITKQVAFALQDLHCFLIIHGDIKLENIVYDPLTHLVVVLDFSFAKFYPREDSVPSLDDRVESFVRGSRVYLPPEVLRNWGRCLSIHKRRRIVYSQDIYALAVCVLGMIYLRLPYPTDCELYDLVKLKEEVGNLLNFKGIEKEYPGAGSFLQKALSANPAGRPQAGACVNSKWLQNVMVPIEPPWRAVPEPAVGAGVGEGGDAVIQELADLPQGPLTGMRLLGPKS